jgi:hypothetical protein
MGVVENFRQAFALQSWLKKVFTSPKPGQWGEKTRSRPNNPLLAGAQQTGIVENSKCCAGLFAHPFEDLRLERSDYAARE